MKKYISLFTFALAGIFAQANQLIDTADTVVTYHTANADSVLIMHTPNGVTVSVINPDGDQSSTVTFNQAADKQMLVTTSTRRARKGRLGNGAANDEYCDTLKSRSHWSVTLGGLSFGLNSALSAPQGLDIERGKSFEIGMLYAIAANYQLRGNRDDITFGLGLNWRNYRMTKSVRFIPGDGTVGFGAYPDGVNPQSSRLLTFSLTMPLVYSCNWRAYNSSNHFFNGFYVGGILNFNTFGSVCTKWLNSEGYEVEELNRNIGQRKFTVDLMAGLNVWRFVSIYAKYSPMKVLKSGPQFSTLSTGVMIGF